MSKNTSDFIGTLPLDFDVWNDTFRLDYYNETLLGFSDLNSTTQNWIIDISRTDVQGLWHWYIATVSNPLGTAAEFFRYVALYPMTPTTTLAPDDGCDSVDSTLALFINYYSIPAFLTVVCLMFLKKRKMLAPNCLGMRPGVIYPVNFIDEHSRRWAYAAAFAMISYKSLILFEGKYYWLPEAFNDPEWTNHWGWTKVMIAAVNVFQLGLCFYPILACIVLHKHILANLLGIASITPWIWAAVVVYQDCPILGARDQSRRISGIFQLIFDIPTFIGCLLILVCFLYDLGLNIFAFRMRTIVNSKGNIRPFFKDESSAVKYVKAMMKKKIPQPQPRGICEKFKIYFTYNNIEGFYFPLRLICTMVVAFLALYKIGTGLGGGIYYAFEGGKSLLESTKDILFDSNNTELYDQLKELLDVGQWSFLVSNITSIVLHFFFMVHMVISYKQHVLKIFRGDRSWHHDYRASPASEIVSGMRYSGYQIAFLINGYIIMMVLLSLVLTALAYLLVIPLINGQRSIIIDQVINLWPTLLFSGLTFISQILLAKFCFLQERGNIMALNNRRLYHVASFFLFFFNILVGIFSCLKRILISLGFGVVLISRLDRCLLMRGAERFDSGFSSYLGMLSVEVSHNHPVMKAFVEILLEETAETRRTAHQIHIQDLEKGDLKKQSEKQMMKKRIRNKWWKYVTLANNPEIYLERMHKDIKEAKKNLKFDKEEIALDTIAGAGAIIIGATIADTFTTDF